MDNKQEDMSGPLLVEMLEKQKSLYEQLRILADRQKSLVTTGESETLLKLLADRQRLVDGLVALNAEIAPYRRQWPEFYAGLDETDRTRTAKLLEDVNGSLSAILQSDSKDSATLQAKRHEIVGQMASYDAGRRASAAYGRQGAGARAGITDSKV